MPELPEVETVRRGLEPCAVGQRIEGVIVRDARLRWPVPANLPRYAQGRRIDSVSRRAKY
ncbi:DNA-formamidopyrimidine glycosylase family protein, partial [Acinetobacter baumannii]